jgi:hypothetical protein
VNSNDCLLTGMKLMGFVRHFKCKIRTGYLVAGIAATCLPITLSHLAAQRTSDHAAQPTQRFRVPGANDGLASIRNTVQTSFLRRVSGEIRVTGLTSIR